MKEIVTTDCTMVTLGFAGMSAKGFLTAARHTHHEGLLWADVYIGQPKT